MKDVLYFVLGLVMIFIAQLIGAGFFWLLHGNGTPQEFWSEFDKGIVFRNEVVGGFILVLIMYIILEITGKINFL